jgi:RimJ/RimL family protein N-acetyltransferase
MAAEAPSLGPVILEGRHVRLEPLSKSHLAALTAESEDVTIFQHFPASFSGAAGMKAFFNDALQMREKGTGLPFVIIAKAEGKPVGSTRFGNFDRRHRRAEIGWTWLAARHQRTGVNTEMKYLMLRHAFETLKLIRVEFKTDSLNQKSRNALKRIGAVEEGIFRNHMITQSGRIRHSVWYSITDGDWPSVKRRFEEVLLCHPEERSDEGSRQEIPRSARDDTGRGA